MTTTNRHLDTILNRQLLNPTILFFDLRRIRKYKDEQIYLNEIKKRSQWRKIKTLFVIDSNEKLLTIKGKFVSMEL